MEAQVQGRAQSQGQPQAQTKPEDTPLCRLRQELKLNGRLTGQSAAGVRLLYDPVTGKFYRLDPPTFLLLTHWEEGTPAKVLKALWAKRGIRMTVNDVLTVNRFLENNALAQPSSKVPKQRQRLEDMARKRADLKTKLLNQYLFFKIPFCQPEKFLETITPWLKPFFAKGLWITVAVMAVVFGLLILRQWDVFWNSFPAFFRLEGFVAYAFVIVISKTFHELAHAVALKHYADRTPVMGLAVMMFMPLLYTDASESWRISNPKDRLKVAAAGILSEIFLATMASGAWLLLDDGPWRSAAFVLATTNWAMTLLFNLNPLMRFDGYFILSDALGIENLQMRSLVQLKNAVSEALWRCPLPGVEHFPTRKAKAMVVFGFASLLYRLSVISGIIVLVYTFFFKALGVLLLGHQLWKCIFMPMKKGLLWSRQNRAKLRPTPLFWGTVLMLLGTGVFLCLPLADRIYAEGLSTATTRTTLFTKSAGVVLEAADKSRGDMKAGEVLLRMQSPELAEQIKLESLRLERLTSELAVAGFHQSLNDRRLLIEDEVKRSETAIANAKAKMQDLTITLPYDAYVDWIPTGELQGTWLSENEPVVTLEAKGEQKVVAFVGELDRDRVKVGNRTLFYPDYDVNQPIAGEIVYVSDHEVQTLTEPAFNVVYGGEILVDAAKQKPVHAYYRVEVALKEAPQGFLRQQHTGTLLIKGEGESLLMRSIRKIGGLFIRESVF